MHDRVCKGIAIVLRNLVRITLTFDMCAVSVLLSSRCSHGTCVLFVCSWHHASFGHVCYKCALCIRPLLSLDMCAVSVLWFAFLLANLKTGIDIVGRWQVMV